MGKCVQVCCVVAQFSLEVTSQLELVTCLEPLDVTCAGGMV